jgi:hypothetical protein
MSLNLRYADHMAVNLGDKDMESQADKKEHTHRHNYRWRFANLLGIGRSPALRRRRAIVLGFLLITIVMVTLWNTNTSQYSRGSISEKSVLAVDQKVSVVVMNHNRPRMIRESQLLKTFTSHPAIDQILLCHSNPETKFDFQHEKVTNIDAVEDNNKMGLSLRFHYCSKAQNDWVIIVDDDMELSSAAVDMLLSEFAVNTKRIVGHYGRNYNWYRAFYRNGYDTRIVTGPAEVVLTKIMVIESDMCGAFFRHDHLMQDLLPESTPLWNGEDIFMSLVANHEYGVPVNGPFRNYAIPDLDVWEASDEFKDDVSGAADVSGNVDSLGIWKDGPGTLWKAVKKSQKHAAYRGKLWNTAKQRLAALEYSL